MTDNIYTGRCLCGRIRFQAGAPVSSPCYCHCESCRRATGAPFVAWASFASDSFTVTTGELAEYPSSPGVSRGYCADCGTALTYANGKQADRIDITVVTLDAADTLAPTAHIWLADKLVWVKTDDGLPGYPGWRTVDA